MAYSSLAAARWGGDIFLSSRAGFDIVVVCDFGSFLWYFGYRVGYSLPSCINFIAAIIL